MKVCFRVWVRMQAFGCVALPALVLIPWFLWALAQVATARSLRESQAQFSHYPCVTGKDELLPYKVKARSVGERVYFSLGGENWVQAVWLIPLNHLAVGLLHSKEYVAKTYAVSAAAYADSPTGYDNIAALLYRRNYCALTTPQRRVEYVTHPLPELIGDDAAARQEVQRAQDLISQEHQRQLAAHARQ